MADDDLIAGKTLAEWQAYNREADAQLERMKAWGAALVGAVWLMVVVVFVLTKVVG